MPQRRASSVVLSFCLALLCAIELAACSSSPSPASTTTCAWAVGRNGTILATADGGAHWARQPSGTTRSLNGVAFADASCGWIVGGAVYAHPGRSADLVLSTTDAGARWSSHTFGRPGAYLTAVACTDTAHIWVGGAGPGIASPAQIFASTDGGATWIRQYSGPTSKRSGDTITAIALADSDHGWATTASGRVLATSDGGAHWVVQTTLPAATMPLAATCTDARHCWVTGMGGTHSTYLLATGDGGATWHPVSLPALVSTEAVWSDEAGHLYLGGVGTHAPGAIYTSADGGASWKAGTGLSKEVSAITGAGSGRLWAICVDSIVSSGDGGATWTTRLSRPKLYFWGIGCPPAGSSAGR